MGDAMSDAYKEEREWEKVFRLSEEAEDLAFKDEEYRNLVDAHIAISILIGQQVATCAKIRNKRIEILKRKLKFSFSVKNLFDLDASRGRKVLSGWVLKSSAM